VHWLRCAFPSGMPPASQCLAVVRRATGRPHRVRPHARPAGRRGTQAVGGASSLSLVHREDIMVGAAARGAQGDHPSSNGQG
jgi:hypothetical protein